MKQIVCILAFALLLSGCGHGVSELDAAMELRQTILTASCRFTAEITADYGEELYTFRMDCSTDPTGIMTFTVTEPASIAGITGTVAAGDAKLTFDETVLAFPHLAGGRIAPVAAPWVFLNTLRSGYISACGKEGEGLLILADDSYEDNALQLEILTDSDRLPVQADIFWNQQRLLSLQITDFTIL